MQDPKPELNCELFLKRAPQFQLGELDTEKPHPLSIDLSSLASDDLDKAYSVLRHIDLEAFCKADFSPLPRLADAIERTFRSGHKIFLCGCGATGRLSLSLETFARQGYLPISKSENLIAFMAGGDCALVRSIEQFEDHPEYGEKQLFELGFKDGDLLIGITEGGETPFVIGAVEAAAEASSEQPWFLYCNPDAQLIAAAERSKSVINNKSIHKINLSTGSMALTGSTRMQASSILMAACGWALARPTETPEAWIKEITDRLKSFNLTELTAFTKHESALYESGHFLNYRTHNLGITLLTDTTERAPTFSLTPFENEQDDRSSPSLCYLSIGTASTAAEAWEQLLKRRPRCLDNWKAINAIASTDRLHGFNISKHNGIKRSQLESEKRICYFDIDLKNETLQLHLGLYKCNLAIGSCDLLQIHLLLKMVLNMHSTLVMGRLGRYSGNLMTWVKPSNMKLIDRAIRYVQILHKQKYRSEVAYDLVATKLFERLSELPADQAIVLETLNALEPKNGIDTV